MERFYKSVCHCSWVLRYKTLHLWWQTAADNSPQELASSVTRGFTRSRWRLELIRHPGGRLDHHHITCLGTEPFRSWADSLPRANQPIGPCPIRSLTLSLPGHFAPGNESSCYLSLTGTFIPWNFGSHNVCLTVYLCMLMLALEGITKLKQYEGPKTIQRKMLPQ